MSELVRKLATGRHRVVVRTVEADPVEELKERIERGYVLVRFTETQGGTELGVRLDGDRTDVSRADFASGKGTVHLAGSLVLDYVKVRCVADVDIESREGEGHLEILEQDERGG